MSRRHKRRRGNQDPERSGIEEELIAASQRWAADGVRGTADSGACLAALLPTLTGRSIVAVRYGVLPTYEEPSPEDFDIWVTDLGGAHLLDFGLEFTLDDGRVLQATWTGPPCYYLGLKTGPLRRSASDIPVPCYDVTNMAPWPALLRRPIVGVTITRDLQPADTFGIAGQQVAVPLDAEFQLEGASSFFLSARRFDPRFGDKRAEPRTDTVLVTFDRDVAHKLGVGPYAPDVG